MIFIRIPIAFILFILLMPPCFILALLIKISSKGPIFYWSQRVGKNNALFYMPKFRTMKENTPEVASHLLGNPENAYTPVGKFIRKMSLDELPQLYSIIKGDMVFVGPRPALYNQYDLINARDEKGISVLIPGITGWAQINGRDDIIIEEKVRLDEEYLNNYSLLFDLKIIFLTILKVMKKDGVSH